MNFSYLVFSNMNMWNYKCYDYDVTYTWFWTICFPWIVCFAIFLLFFFLLQVESDKEILFLRESAKDTRRRVQQLEYQMEKMQSNSNSSTWEYSGIPQIRSLYKRERKQLPLESILCHAFYKNEWTQLFKLSQMMVRIFRNPTRERLLPNHCDKTRAEFIARCRNGISILRWLKELALRGR